MKPLTAFCFSKECSTVNPETKKRRPTLRLGQFLEEKQLRMKKGPRAGEPKPNCFVQIGTCNSCGKKISKTKKTKFTE